MGSRITVWRFRISHGVNNPAGSNRINSISLFQRPTTPWRLPAPAVERAVVDGIVGFLKDTPRLIDEIDPNTEETEGATESAATLAHQLITDEASHLRPLLLDLVHRIEVGASCIRVEIHRTALRNRCLGDAKTRNSPKGKDTTISIELPVTFKRRGVETKLILDRQRDRPKDPDPALVNAVASAHKWFAELKSGSARSIREIAERHGIDKGDVSRILPLAFLAPDIVEAILDGQHPVDLTAYRLKRVSAMPHDWRAQRRLLGFA